MNIAVLSDIHGNLEAFEKALRLCEERRVDAVVCLGDIVGYGPDPGPCVDLARTSCDVCIMGNHDQAVVDGRNLSVLPKNAQAAIERHKRMLTDEQTAWLAGLPLRHEAYNATFVHASPEDPERWHRLDSFRMVQAQFLAFETPICFVGHSHKPAVASDTIGIHRVRSGYRFLVDVGSVGQPRDKDSRLAFAMFDPDAFTSTIIRAHYDVARTVARILEVGLPESLANRLTHGI